MQLLLSGFNYTSRVCLFLNFAEKAEVCIQSCQRHFSPQNSFARTKEENTERSTLLEEIANCIDAAKAQKVIIIHHCADDEADDADNPAVMDCDDETSGSSVRCKLPIFLTSRRKIRSRSNPRKIILPRYQSLFDVKGHV
ncbi:unnamed protein product [Allacma fusca]|uniref:Uncharacterized protein n=1 Tax=Allacma fusca TaxID=39272 RepID=A0A8J2PG11_9HEXA|nr:unnamed protein product [Allacma fusca]